MDPEICSGQKTMDGGRRTPHAARRTDIWITKSLPELSSGETKSKQKCCANDTVCVKAIISKYNIPYYLEHKLGKYMLPAQDKKE